MDCIRHAARLAPFPSPFARLAVIEPGDPSRRDVESFVHAVYLARFGARIRHFLPTLIAYYDQTDRLVAAVGLRSASRAPLFVEQYLSAPIETVLLAHGFATNGRSAIVEAGNFAAISPGTARELILQLTHVLASAGQETVAFVATQQLRNAFGKLRLPLHELAIALPEAVGASAEEWGSYYATRPRLMCGVLTSAHALGARPRPTSMGSAS